MAFTLPNFNLLCNVYTGPWNTAVLRIADQACNLAFSKRTARYSDFPIENEASQLMYLLLPALVDIRSTLCGYVADSVEVPAGSGRVYLVVAVDDIGKGFPNEHRCATLASASEAKFGTGSEYNGLFWPTPIP